MMTLATYRIVMGGSPPKDLRAYNGRRWALLYDALGQLKIGTWMSVLDLGKDESVLARSAVGRFNLKLSDNSKCACLTETKNGKITLWITRINLPKLTMDLSDIKTK